MHVHLVHQAKCKLMLRQRTDIPRRSKESRPKLPSQGCSTLNGVFHVSSHQVIFLLNLYTGEGNVDGWYKCVGDLGDFLRTREPSSGIMFQRDEGWGMC